MDIIDVTSPVMQPPKMSDLKLLLALVGEEVQRDIKEETDSDVSEVLALLEEKYRFALAKRIVSMEADKSFYDQTFRFRVDLKFTNDEVESLKD